MKRENKAPEHQGHHSIKKKKIISICVLVAGVATLVVGVVFLIINLVNASRAADGEYLVTAGNWVLDGEEGVIWGFTEIGKGSLTTNNHLNDYDFEWAIEDNKLLIKTDWLYDLDNEYEYKIDQNAGILTLDDGSESYKFIKSSD